MRITMNSTKKMLLVSLILLLEFKTTVSAVKITSKPPFLQMTAGSSLLEMSTVAAPTRKRERYRRKSPLAPQERTQTPLEYLLDEDASRGDDEPFHILLLGDTFEKPRMTESYVVGQLCYTLGMPEPDAQEHAAFASEQGISCLGIWSRKICLELGEKLQARDLVCRVVPLAKGGGQS